MSISIGFVGVGRMGQAMCRHILRGGFPLSVFDVRAEAMQPKVIWGIPMNALRLSEMEQRISQLSREEQLWLIEWLAHHLRESSARPEAMWADELTVMAADPQIQQELRRIDDEFAMTEASCRVGIAAGLHHGLVTRVGRSHLTVQGK